MKIRIKDGRESLWRWDTGRAIFVDEVDNVSRLDFNQSRKLSISVKDRNEDGSWDVPDAVLMNVEVVEVVAVSVDDKGVMSMVSAPLKIVDRARPSDYIYTQDEINTFTDAIQKVKELVDGVSEVDVQLFKTEDGVRLVTTDREGKKTSEVILNGRPGRDGKDAKEYDDTEIKTQVRQIAGAVEMRMMRVVLYLSQSGSVYALRDKDGQDVSFDQLYELVKDESNYVVVLFGNSKLRPQYVSVNEIHADGEDRDSQGTIFLRMIMTPSSLYYGSFRLADKADIPDLTGYVKNTDYATSEIAGIVRTYSGYGTVMRSNQYLASSVRTLQQYNDMDVQAFISKGTLENILPSKVSENAFLFAEYGVTSRALIDNALIAGKMVYIKDGENFYMYSYKRSSDGLLLFTSPLNTVSNGVYGCTLTTSNVWRRTIASFQDAANRINDIANYKNSTAHYPSSKAVYDFVSSFVKEWTQIANITMQNVASSVDVDLSNYTEICIIGACQGTANSNLTTNITTLATAVSATSLRRFMLHAQSMAGGTMVYGRYGSGHSLSAVLSVTAMDNYPLSSINKIGLSDPSYLTSCDIKIYAR